MSLQLAPDARQEIDTIVARYPRAHSAILPVMHVIQREHGYITQDARVFVSELLDMAPVKVAEVLSFYSMLYTSPVGKKHLQICRSMSCWLRGEEEITEAIKAKLGIGSGERTEDGAFSCVKVECLGSCDTAPVVQVNDDYHENLTPEKMGQLLEEWSR